MKPSMANPQALIDLFEQATTRQGAQLRKAVSDTTLAVLQGRELTLKNIRAALKAVSEAASQGVANNMVQGVDPEALLSQVVGGMDDALLKAVEANQRALTVLAGQGADLREGHLKKALAELEKMEDSLFATLKKTAASANTPLAGAWGSVLEKVQAQGTMSGAQAAAAVQDMADYMQTALRQSRAAGLRTAQVMAESYTALVSGVLLGMSEALQSTAPARKTGRR